MSIECPLAQTNLGIRQPRFGALPTTELSSCTRLAGSRLPERFTFNCA
jgi:hypothetical protein